MRAVLSDIHGNLDALDAVLADAARHGAGEIICLGDLAVPGPNPVECLGRATTWPVVLLGNFDQFVLVDPDGAPDTIFRALHWTRAELERHRRSDLWDYLSDRPRTHRDGPFLFVHGSARNPLNEYVFPEDVHNPRKLGRIFALIERYCFCGHTHIPGVFTEDETYHDPAEFGGVWHLDGRKTIVNVGSVGQPRDCDPRACYVLLDDRTVTFRRVGYDVDAVVRKIYAVPELDNFFGDRLREGR